MKLIITDENNLLDAGQTRYFQEAAECVFRQEILPEFLMESREEEESLSEQIEVDVTITDPEEIRRVNAEFRDTDKVTDVLSFPQYEGKDEVLDALEYLEEEQTLILGDVLLCHEKAMEQAEEYGNLPERELCYLFVHSMLHLLGYDHMEEDERKIMRGREEAIMREVGLTREESL